MKVVETQDLASLRGTNKFVSLDFHINGHDLMDITESETVGVES